MSDSLRSKRRPVSHEVILGEISIHPPRLKQRRSQVRRYLWMAGNDKQKTGPSSGKGRKALESGRVAGQLAGLYVRAKSATKPRPKARARNGKEEQGRH
jgi:hypothetical protein